jgi:hypothetical protein
MSPIVSPRCPRERSRRPPLRVLGGRGESGRPRTPSPESSERSDLDPGGSCSPALRIVADEGPSAAPEMAAPVLLVGANAWRRAALRSELRATLPPRTRFAEADDVAEVLERARSSRMVILAGDLDDADAESLMRLLGRRHPRLPVVCVIEEPMPAVAGGRG